MPYIQLSNPDGTSVSIGITGEEALSIFKRSPRQQNKYLNYDLAFISQFYGDLNLIETSVGSERIRVPYILEHDYRSSQSQWGIAKISGTYHIPSQLEMHRKAMIDRFKEENRLYKGDSMCPRVSDFSYSESNEPIFHIERAWYTDQVGSNLTLDYPLPERLHIGQSDCNTVREWDCLQSMNSLFNLPSFSKSRLANTIGVSIGITCYTKKGHLALLRRQRAKNVAVYSGMWASPFAFALSLSQDIRDCEIPIQNLISFDLGVEFAEEMGLEISDFSAPTPIAFCRDLVRGGKPQFFFEMHTNIEFETIAEYLGKKNAEYQSRVAIINDKISDKNITIAPELACFVALKIQGKN